jgi:altronate dehydratase
MPRTSLTVHPDDNVATLLDFNVDDPVTTEGLRLAESIPFGHKVALRPIQSGEPVVKYGVAIGSATQNIPTGAHVHVHNCR